MIPRYGHVYLADLKGLSINTFDISHPIFGPSLNGSQSNKPHHSQAMPQLGLNRSVQIQLKSWRDFVKGIDGQTLIHDLEPNPERFDRLSWFKLML